MKKGFTLVELLGVIVILTVIGFIAVPTALNMYRESKKELSDLTEQVLITSTKSYVNDNENDFPINNGNVYCVSLKKVVRENYLKTPVIDANTGEEIDLDKIVEVKVKNNDYEISLNDSCVAYIGHPLTMSVPSGIINEHGWAKEDFNVSISGDGLTAYKYCISNKICKPNITVNQSSGLIPINTEGIHYLCAHGINAEGNTDIQCDIYKLDKTDPIIGSIVLSGTEGLNGYYVSNVYVSNTPSTDALSGILTDILSPNAGTVTTDTEGTVYTLTATDKAGNTSSTSYTLKIDKTLPNNGLVEFVGTKGENDWYISDVTVKLNSTEEYTMTSNVSSITENTEGTIVTVKTIDKAGNENPKDYVIKVDKTKPVVGTFDIVGTLGENNWYISDVTIKGTGGSDDVSGPVTSIVDISSITSNTEGTIVTLTTTNDAGLTSTDTVTIKVDKDKPVLTAKEGTFEITIGDDVDSKTFFNDPVYSISGEGSYSCTPATTSKLEIGTETITCTITGGNGLSTETSVEILIEPKGYLVTLNNQDATTPGTESVNAKYGRPMPAITLPTKTGYTFGGYYTSTGGSGTQYYTATGASARDWNQNATDILYAKWTANKYAITLDNQGATSAGTTSINATYGSAMPSITKPSKTGYTFGGYYTEPNGGGTQYYTATGASAQKWDQTDVDTLYAKWTANQYTITFNQQSGSGGTSSIKATYDSPMPEITLPTRAGYTFAGYYTSTNGGGTQYYNSDGTSTRNYDQTAADTLYAKWTANLYVIKLDSQSATTTGTTSVEATYASAMPAITVPTKTGYTFGGYYTEPNGGGTQYYTAAGASARAWNQTEIDTLYAKWTANKYTITFDRQGGSNGTSSTNATYESAMPVITKPTRTGYTFGGYYTEPNGGGTQYYTAAGASAKNWDQAAAATLYAKWTANTYTITFNDQEATTTGTASTTATYGSVMPTITLPAKTGYTFGGYYTSTGGSGTQYYTDTGGSARNWNQTADDILYAKWTANKYAVTLNNQGATSAGTTSINATYGSAMPSITKPSKTGYTFGGYFTGTEGSGTQYYTAAGGSAQKWDQIAIDTLYASWTANTYKITFNQQSGSGGTVSTTATYGSAMPTIVLPTRGCYIFDGYYTSTNGGGTQYYTKTGASARNYDQAAADTLYASWIENFDAYEYTGEGYDQGTCGNYYEYYTCGKKYIGYTACETAPSCYITMSPTSFSVGSAQTITLYATCDVDASTLTSNSWSGLKYTNGESDRISGYKIGIPSGAKVGTTSEWAGTNTITFTACNSAGCDTSYVTYTVN